MNRFRLMAASLVLLLGASAATFAQPMEHGRQDTKPQQVYSLGDRDSNRGAVVDRDDMTYSVYGRNGDDVHYQVRRDQRNDKRGDKDDAALRSRTDRDDHDQQVRVRTFENGRGQARDHANRER